MAIDFELLYFLKVWLTRHMDESDKRYGGYFLSRGIEARWPTKVAVAEKKHSWKFWSRRSDELNMRLLIRFFNLRSSF